MGKIAAFSIPGMMLVFNSLDHLPMHFHAIKTDKWHIRVKFMECAPGKLAYSIKRGTAPTSPERSLLLEKVLLHRAALAREWSEKVVAPPEGVDRIDTTRAKKRHKARLRRSRI